ncbi:MAG: hypothetical protein ACT4TC_06715 [Myxococcaceae bacterium]
MHKEGLPPEALQSRSLGSGSLGEDLATKRIGRELGTGGSGNAGINEAPAGGTPDQKPGQLKSPLPTCASAVSDQSGTGQCGIGTYP